jgi:hypothetical protein
VLWARTSAVGIVGRVRPGIVVIVDIRSDRSTIEGCARRVTERCQVDTLSDTHSTQGGSRGAVMRAADAAATRGSRA